MRVRENLLKHHAQAGCTLEEPASTLFGQIYSKPIQNCSPPQENNFVWACFRSVQRYKRRSTVNPACGHFLESLFRGSDTEVRSPKVRRACMPTEQSGVTVRSTPRANYFYSWQSTPCWLRRSGQTCITPTAFAADLARCRR